MTAMLRLLALAMCVTAPALAAGVDAPPVASASPSPGASAPVPAAVDIGAEAAAIDALVAADLARHHQQPNPPIDDATFLRRIYLTAAGRIPTLEEAQAFLADQRADRRSQLIDRLVGSPAWVDQEFSWWADFLRIESQPQKRLPGEPYIEWIKHALATDMPYDQLVRALLTASGPVIARGNGATGFYLRDAGMPLDNMSFTVQEFLGTRVACAQCHNHPFDTWTRLQYTQMAAYTAGVGEAPQPAMVRALRQIARSQGQFDTQEKKALQLVSRTVLLEVRPPTRAQTILPKDYQYADGHPGEPVVGHPLFGDDITVAPGEDPRIAYAAWMTSPRNPRFTLVIANRLWKKVMGLGLIEPVDNLTASTTASDPELLAHLTDLMTRIGYDTRLYQRILLSTASWQRAAVVSDVTAPEEFAFPGPLARRLRAEEVWDSLMTLIIPAVDERHGTASAEGLYALYDSSKDKTPEELWSSITSTMASVRERQDLQARLRALIATFPSREAASQDPGVRQLREQLQHLATTATGTMALAAYRRQAPPETDPRWRGYPRDLVRAAELPSPAPPGHFLRDFGQSDRQLIDNASNAPAITQALALLNGIVDQQVLDAHAVVMQSLATLPDAHAQIRAAFLAILSRLPSVQEEEHLSGPQAPPLADIVWALVNSREFLFLR